jgi:uncharacterized membrane protein YczE
MLNFSILAASSEKATKSRTTSFPNIKRRMLALLFGNIIMGLAMSMLRLSLFGNDPFSCMNLGYSNVSALSFGTCIILFNCVLIIPVLLFERSYIQIGTLVNMFLLGPFSDLWYDLLLVLFGSTELPLSIRIALLVFGVTISCFGASLYICAKLGMGPYDAIGWILVARSGQKFKFRYVRMCIDFVAVSIGFTFGSIVGLGTLTMAFFTGPLISFFNNKINMRLIYPNDPEAVKQIL